MKLYYPVKPVPTENLTFDNKNQDLLTDVHYAIQTCDIAGNVHPGEKDSDKERYVKAPKAEIIRKCLTSLFESIEYCIQKIPYSTHTVMIFDDHSTQETLDFFERLQKRFTSKKVKIEVHNLEDRGIMNSTRHCYEWMDREGKGLVYQVQDDMLYMPKCLFEIIDFWNQVRLETEAQSIIVPWNDAWHHRVCYRYTRTARMIVQGKYQFWFSSCDIPSGFLTGAEEFRKHWDKYEHYLRMDPWDPQLEPASINTILTDQRTFSFRPFNSLAFHLQTKSRDLDPYHDWQYYWDRVEDV